MSSRNDFARRHFVQRVGVLTALGLGARLNVLDFIREAHAQSAGDYRALVCVFLFGGNDGNNTIVPFDNAGYAQPAPFWPKACSACFKLRGLGHARGSNAGPCG